MRYESTRKRLESGASHPTGVSGPAPSDDTLTAQAHIVAHAVKPSQQGTTVLMTVPTQEMTELPEASPITDDDVTPDVLPTMGTDVSEYNDANDADEASPMAVTPEVTVIPEVAITPEVAVTPEEQNE